MVKLFLIREEKKLHECSFVMHTVLNHHFYPTEKIFLIKLDKFCLHCYISDQVEMYEKITLLSLNVEMHAEEIIELLAPIQKDMKSRG